MIFLVERRPDDFDRVKADGKILHPSGAIEFYSGPFISQRFELLLNAGEWISVVPDED